MIVRQYHLKKESSTQGDDGPSSKRFRAITKEEENKRNLPQNMMNQAYENSDKYIPAKDFKEAILIKTFENGRDKKSNCKSQMKFRTFYLDWKSQLLPKIYQGISIVMLIRNFGTRKIPWKLCTLSMPNVEKGDQK